MPPRGSGIPKKKFDRCVKQVKAKGKGNPFAICTSALKKKGKKK